LQVERMVQEAERNAEEDKKRREVIDLKNQVIVNHWYRNFEGFVTFPQVDVCWQTFLSLCFTLAKATFVKFSR
jgi:hypothetical protein